MTKLKYSLTINRNENVMADPPQPLQETDVLNVLENTALNRRNDSANDVATKNLSFEEGPCCSSNLEQFNTGQIKTQEAPGKNINNELIDDSGTDWVHEHLRLKFLCNEKEKESPIYNLSIPTISNDEIENKHTKLFIEGRDLADEIIRSHRNLIEFLDSYKKFFESRKLCKSLLRQQHAFVTDSLVKFGKSSERLQTANTVLGDVNDVPHPWASPIVILFALIRGAYDFFFGHKLSKNDIRSDFFKIRESLQVDNSRVCEVYYTGSMCSTQFQHTRKCIQKLSKEIRKTSLKKDDFEDDEDTFKLLCNLSIPFVNTKKFYKYFKSELEDFIETRQRKKLNKTDQKNLKPEKKLARVFDCAPDSIQVIDFLLWVFDNQNFNFNERKIANLNAIDSFLEQQNFKMELFVSQIEQIILCLEEEENILNETVTRLGDEYPREDNLVYQRLGRDIIKKLYLQSEEGDSAF